MGSTCLINLFHLIARSCASSLVNLFCLGSPLMLSIHLNFGRPLCLLPSSTCSATIPFPASKSQDVHIGNVIGQHALKCNVLNARNDIIRRVLLLFKAVEVIRQKASISFARNMALLNMISLNLIAMNTYMS